MTANITDSSLDLDRKRMMTRVRIIRPIMETAVRMAEGAETMGVKAGTVGKIQPLFFPKIKKLMDSNMRDCATTETKKVSPRIKSMVSAWISSSRAVRLPK